ncbi:HxlR-like helix-turn-helix [Halopenitus malekzadehii]|uniref:HxlR-like helix-turn-helix n=1 Tax=Halopenitus malekzadehii TaxID=1267564 RepID=A0A1H6K056_9EURY|nr:HxlR-like helix-turn-helix [Halopenitus malekzadehii]
MATQPPSVDADHESDHDDAESDHGSGDESDPDDVEGRNADVCTVVAAVEEMGSKWKLIVLNDLQDGEKRFNELKRSTGASSYTLSRVLEDWLRAGSSRTARSSNRRSRAITR